MSCCFTMQMSQDDWCTPKLCSAITIHHHNSFKLKLYHKLCNNVLFYKYIYKQIWLLEHRCIYTNVNVNPYCPNDIRWWARYHYKAYYLPHNIIHIECEEYFMEYCHSHITMLWIWIILCFWTSELYWDFFLQFKSH